MSFGNARSYCKKRGQYLAVPMNQYQTDYIRNLLPSGDVQAWLGLYQNDDMMWFTDYGRSAPMWYNWMSGNDYMYGRRSGMMGAAMRWRDGWNGYWYDMDNFEGRQYYVVCENFYGQRDNMMRNSMMSKRLFFKLR